MPNNKSAEKRLKQNHTRRLHNRAAKSAVKTQAKRVLKAVQAGDVETAEKEFVLAQKKLDQAGSRRVIHPNAAARQKSRLQNAIKKAKQAPA